MSLYGYANCILHVDLSKRKAVKRDLNVAFPKMYLGSRGFAVRIAYDEITPKTDPFSPENRLVFATGPLTGTIFSPKIYMCAKSPLTEGLISSGVGGHFGAELRSAGYDAVVVSGRSDRPVYIVIDDEEVTVKDARNLWGKDAFETELMIKEEVGNDFCVASIGVAGENLVRYACVGTDLYRHFGRGGTGAVFGSKNLKAIAVRGTRELRIKNIDKFEEKTKELYQYLLEAGRDMTTYGTMSIFELISSNWILPTKNFQYGIFDKAEKINAKYMRKYLRKSDWACRGCPVRCGKVCEVAHRKYGSFVIVGPEYEATVLLGSNCGVESMESIAYFNLLCDKYGLDTISTGNVIAFSIELFEKGIINEKDTDGLKLTWGNEEAIAGLIEKIANRNGIGHVLAEGVMRAAKNIGKGADKYAMHVKGLEIPGYDPRGAWGMGLAYATANRGACHLAAWTLGEELGYLGRYYAPKKKALLVAVRQNRKAIIDALGACEVLGLPPIFGDILSAITGWEVRHVYNSVFDNLIEDYIIDGERAYVGDRIYTLERAFNVREGFRRQQDTLPERFFSEHLMDFEKKGHVIDRITFEKMLSEYYNIRGWDDNGIPNKEKLESLGLFKESKDLHDDT